MPRDAAEAHMCHFQAGSGIVSWAVSSARNWSNMSKKWCEILCARSGLKRWLAVLQIVRKVARSTTFCYQRACSELPANAIYWMPKFKAARAAMPLPGVQSTTDLASKSKNKRCQNEGDFLSAQNNGCPRVEAVSNNRAGGAGGMRPMILALSPVDNCGIAPHGRGGTPV